MNVGLFLCLSIYERCQQCRPIFVKMNFNKCVCSDVYSPFYVSWFFHIQKEYITNAKLLKGASNVMNEKYVCPKNSETHTCQTS